VQNTAFNEINLLNDDTGSYDIHLGTATTITISGEDLATSGAKMGLGGREHFIGPAANSKTGVLLTGAAGDKIKFDFDTTTGAPPEVSIEIAVEGDMTLLQVKNAINALSQASDEYDAASIVYDGISGQYHLKVESPTAGNVDDVLTVVTVTDAGADNSILWDAAVPGLDGVDVLAAHFQHNDGSDGADLTTVAGAASALGAIGNAIAAKDEYRASLGYLMNRLDVAVNVIEIQVENLRTAESRISDVDVATEMAALTRNQVLAQAGISMLAQANSIPQMALKLLG